MDGGTTMPAAYAEGAHSQVAYRDGVWWHWRRPTQMFPGWVPVTGAKPAPIGRPAGCSLHRYRLTAVGG